MYNKNTYLNHPGFKNETIYMKNVKLLTGNGKEENYSDILPASK